MPVTTFLGADLAPRLSAILAILDQAEKLAEGGYSTTHLASKLAREMLHDLVAEVSE